MFMLFRFFGRNANPRTRALVGVLVGAVAVALIVFGALDHSIVIVIRGVVLLVLLALAMLGWRFRAGSRPGNPPA
ncbi:MAG: hypothetical protein ACREOD_01750 [Candidatus Dormibacteria bacterium]